jgi:hypothetical protein
VLLALILGFAFYTSLIPRLDSSYPVHQDEWTHMAEARAIVTTGDIPMQDPVTGEPRSSPYPEVGYHLFLAETQLLTGLPWATIFRFLHSVVFALTVLGAYMWGKGRGFGVEAALFASFLPTTVRFLGPAFAVPMALGLLFVPLILYLVSDLWSSRRLVAILAVLLSFLYISHPPTALFVSLIVGVHGLFQTVRRATDEPSERRRPWSHLAMVLAVVALSSLPFLLYNHGFISTAVDQPPIPDAVLTVPGGMIQRLGYLTYILFVLGLGLLALGERRTDRALLLETVLVATAVFLFHAYRIGPEVMYSRGILYLSLLMLLIAGLATGRLRRWLAKGLRPVWPDGAPFAAAGLIAIALLLPSLWLSVQSRYEEDYNQAVDQGEYQDFVWIRENLCLDGLTLINPTLGRPFAAVTGKQVYAPLRLSVAPVIWPEVEEARRVLQDGVPDASWLRERGVSIVYSETPVRSPDLVQVRERVYVLPPAEVCPAADSAGRLAASP